MRTLQATGTLGAGFLVGPIGKSTTRESVTPSLSLQVSPSFDIDNVDSKDFVTGIASPIDTKFVKYWLDRGVPPEVILQLFFSSAEISFLDAEKYAENARKKKLEEERLS